MAGTGLASPLVRPLIRGAKLRMPRPPDRSVAWRSFVCSMLVGAGLIAALDGAAAQPVEQSFTRLDGYDVLRSATADRRFPSPTGWLRRAYAG